MASAQQRSAESRQEFQTRMFNMVCRLESKDTVLFHKIVSKSMATHVVQGPYAYSLEFPIDFILQHGKKFEKDVTFEVKGSEKIWPIRITVRPFKHSKPRVFAYGSGGWKTFLMDNQIKVGDILIFTLRSYSRFHVIIGRAPVEVHPDDQVVNGGAPLEVHSDDNYGTPVDVHPDDDEDNQEEIDMDIEEEVEDNYKSSTQWFRNPSPWWNADQALVSCRVCKQAPSCPRFLVAIRPSSHPRHLSLAVPGRFWKLHDNMLECNDLQLRGPNKAICIVKAMKIKDVEEEKLTVRLESGWEAFRVANKLRVGDILEFFLVGRSCFTVDLVEGIKKN